MLNRWKATYNYRNMWVEVFECSSWPCQQSTVASCRENHCVQLWHLLVHLQPHGAQAWQVHSTVLPVGRKGTDQLPEVTVVSALIIQSTTFRTVFSRKRQMWVNQQHTRWCIRTCHQGDHSMLLATGRKPVLKTKPLKKPSVWRTLNSHCYQVFTELAGRSNVSIAITSFSFINFKCCSPNYDQSLKKKSPLYLSVDLVFVMNGNFHEI